MKTLIKIDRIAAWVLFLGVIIYFITGYGMTKGFISSELSLKLHLDYLVYIVIIAFLIHTPFAIHLSLKRWKFWNIFSKVLLALFVISFVCLIFYLEFIYEKKPAEAVSNTTEEVEDVGDTVIDSSESAAYTQTDEKTFTKDELAYYDGKDGRSAYVAVDGDVYDLTGVFREGAHFSHFAGMNLTNEFYSAHAKRVLDKYPVVGKMAE